MAPSGKKSSEEALFAWIVSDFGLNDAIESGLVKTPRVVIRDDGKMGPDYKSRLYHIYNDPEVKDDVNRKAQEFEPLPDLVINGYYLLGKDWLDTRESWEEVGFKIPPVMISVANRTETAARIKYAFDHHKIVIEELCDPEKILHIDSKVLEMAESQEEPQNSPDPEEEDQEEETVRKLSQERTGGTPAADRGYGWANRETRRADSKSHFSGYALGRLGRQNRYPHYGDSRLFQPVAVRAGGRAGATKNVLRGQSGNRFV